MTELVICTATEVELNWPDQSIGQDGWTEERRIEDAIRKLNVAYEHGVRSLVDRTLPGTGRNVPRVKRIAEATPVNILVSTGWYTFDNVPIFFDYRDRMPELNRPEDLMIEDLFVRDLEDGIADTGVRAAIIKCSTDASGLTPGVTRLIEAAAKAHRSTGAPITTHTGVGIGAPSGLLQQQVLEREGVDLSRVLIGHVDFTPGDGLEEIQQLIDKGSYVGFDTVVFTDLMNNWQSRIDRIVELCARGHADKIVLSHDQACFLDLRGPVEPRGFATYTEVGLALIPALQERGITDDQIEQMMVRNPQRIFESRDLGPY